MEFKEREFIPVAFGEDINTYSVARAFYEAYQVKTYVFGKYPTGLSYNSKLTIYHANPQNDEDGFFLNNINSFAKKHSDKKILAIGCGDNYVALLSKHKAKLADNIIAPYIDFQLMDSLQQKKLFYSLCSCYLSGCYGCPCPGIYYKIRREISGLTSKIGLVMEPALFL